MHAPKAFAVPLVWLGVATAVGRLFPTANAFSAQQQPVKTWTPKVPTLEERRKLRGQKHSSETIGSLGFHHVEFYCSDAKSAATQFASSLGMKVTGITGQSTGNDQCSSYALQSGDFRLLLTAPYSTAMASLGRRTSAAQTQAHTQSQSQSHKQPQTQTSDFDAPHPLPGFHADRAHDFFRTHGLAARAIGLLVRDADRAFQNAVQNGARPVLQPCLLPTCKAQKHAGAPSSECRLAEVELYGDVVLRFVSHHPPNQTVASVDTARTTEPSQHSAGLPFLPHLAPITGKLADRPTFGIRKIDHAVGNVHNLQEALEYIAGFTGFHEFAEFTAEDVGTVDSGLNSVVLASDTEDVLLPLNEPVSGKRKSQIQTYLEQNEGAGLQHLALKTDDIYATVRKMRSASDMLCGFELMARPSDIYYKELPDRLGDQLSPDQYRMLEEEGILADADDEGVLLQLFTKPIGDRPTFFVEIIQRIGCVVKNEDDDSEFERPGCGGFGKGNFRELFRSIEELEKTLKV